MIQTREAARPYRSMGRGFGPFRAQPAIWMTTGVILAAVAAGAAWLARARETPVRYTGVPRIELPLPGVAQQAAAPAWLSAGTAGVDPLRPDLSLLEDGPFGPLPRIAPDGRRPFLAYARSFDLADSRPKIAVLLVGFSLQPELLDAALTLPKSVALQFSPYAPDLPAMVARARAAGHEVLLELPMAPAEHRGSDRGPDMLQGAGDRDETLERLRWVLARASGYVALTGDGARSAGGVRAEAILDELARRGLALIELGARRLAPAAAAAGLPYASARRIIDGEPPAPTIDRTLTALEAEASAAGSALAVARAGPGTMEGVRRWAAVLEAKGLVLAPVSAVLIEQAGLARAASTDSRRAPARSEG